MRNDRECRAAWGGARGVRGLRLVVAALGLACLFSVAGAAEAPAPGAEWHLRGYRDFTHNVTSNGEGEAALALHTFSFKDPERAAWFVSKIYSDYELTSGNVCKEVKTARGVADAIILPGGGMILPLLAKSATAVTVLAGPEAAVLTQAAGKGGAPLRRAALTHPQYLDKWDRYCLGVWDQPNDCTSDSVYKTPDSFHQWVGKLGVTAQINTGTINYDMVLGDNLLTWFRRYFAKDGIRYQRVEWLGNQHDLYNRNPYLLNMLKPDMASIWDYYGERPQINNPLRAAQEANTLQVYRRTAGDANQMALLDPNGEIGPFDTLYTGLHGPMIRREFVRFLQEVRKLDLAAAGERYEAKADAYKGWDDVSLADWRHFYGWTDGAQDLAGEWRFQRDETRDGFTRGWSGQDCDDSGWVRLYYPGDALAFGIAGGDAPLWMRKTFTPDPRAWPGRVYLSFAPLTDRTVQVFLNGAPLGSLTPRFHTAWTWGQFDITDAVKQGKPLTLSIRFASADRFRGPIFLTPKKAEDFPTSDPRVNARRWDHLEFIDWLVAQSVAGTLRGLRSVDPDRPIKVHAYERSAWGWKTVRDLGGYSHHTGSGPGWQWCEPKSYGLGRQVQDSSEPGGPVNTLREFRGIWGSLIYMGKNAHDYFISFNSITRDPQKRAYLEEKAPAIRVMGRANVLTSPIALIRGHLNTLYAGEFARWEAWRYGVQVARGGELPTLLDEIRLREGKLGAYRVIIDEGAECWDEDMTQALREYVEQGGILVLNSLSGRHTFVERDKGGAAQLAGVRIAGPAQQEGAIRLAGQEAVLPGLAGGLKIWGRDGVRGVSLEAAGARVVGTWPDNTPALTAHTVGKGTVLYCGGSLFPPELIKNLIEIYGPATYASAEGGFDLLRTARSNNGAEDLVMVRGTGGKELTVRWTLEYAPSRIYDPVTGKDIPAVIEGNRATIKLKLDDWDFAWLAARRPVAPAQFAYWFTRQTEIWQGLVTGAKAPQTTLFRHLDLCREWRAAHAANWDAALALREKDDAAAGLQAADLILWNQAELAKGPAALYRRLFTLPSAWQKNSRLQLAVRGRIHDFPLHGGDGKNEIFLNGKSIWQGEKIDSIWMDVTDLAKPGENANRLEFVHAGPGLMPTVMLVRDAIPASVLDLAGEWRGVGSQREEKAVALPGEFRGAFLYRDITVPAQNKEQEVWLQVAAPCGFAIINGHLRYWDVGGTGAGPQTPMPQELGLNITPDLRFGEVNRIVLGAGATMKGWSASEFKITAARLSFYAPGAWDADGKPIRSTLTEKELSEVTKSAAMVKTYPLIDAAAQVKEPVVCLDLDFSDAANPAIDATAQRWPVKIRGKVEPFAGGNGRIRGIVFAGGAGNPSMLELPQKLFQQKAAGQEFTIRAWIKPQEGAGGQRGMGSLLAWGRELNIALAGESCQVSLRSEPERKMVAEDVLRQRQWQCLTLTVQDGASCLYVNGVAVAREVWPQKQTGSGAPVFLGAASERHGFLNAVLSAFTLYSGAMTPEQVRQRYNTERALYTPAPGDCWPEDDFFQLTLAGAAPADGATLAAAVTTGSGVGIVEAEGRRVLALDGQASYLFAALHGQVDLFSQPFVLIADIRPEPGAEGRIFRYFHRICLDLTKDGTLVFDANIGKRNMIRFPKVIKAGEWNRLVLTYDGKSCAVRVNGAFAGRQEYAANLKSWVWDKPVVFFADNTYPGFPKAGNLKCQVRELRVAPLMPQ